jgi:hypothetical protein
MTIRLRLRNISISGEIFVTIEKTLWPESSSELYRPNDRRLWVKLVPTFSDIGYHVVSVMEPYGRILGFLDPCSHRMKRYLSRRTSLSPNIVEVTKSVSRNTTRMYKQKKQSKLLGLSPRANSNDRVTAAWWQSWCHFLRMKGATWSAWRIPMVVFSVF